MTGKIPATVITGFLGAGKTTLLRHVIENAGGRRLALIINEFGSVGIDTELLRGCGIPACEEADIVELANGCLCCTVADEFLPAMQALLAREVPPEHIVIETSGLALPKPLLKAFGWPDIRSRITVDGVITVVDGPAVLDGRFADDPAAVAAQRAADPGLDHDNPLAEVYEDQLGSADLVVLNKADLLNRCRVEELAFDGRQRPAARRADGGGAGGAGWTRRCCWAWPPGQSRTWPRVRPTMTPWTGSTSMTTSTASSCPWRRRRCRMRWWPACAAWPSGTACCGSRASRRSRASRCGWRSRASARASARASTAPGRRARPGPGRSS